MIENLLLHGGGLDSTAVFLSLIEQEIPFSVLHLNYGHLAASAEMDAIDRQCEKYNIEFTQVDTKNIRRVNECSLLFGDEGASPILDSRNLTVAVIGSYYGNNLYMGLEKPFNNAVAWPDCSHRFIESLNTVFELSYLTRKVKVITPFLEVEKLDVYRAAYTFDRDFFQLSMSCWTPKNGECGTCKHCIVKAQLMNEVTTTKEN